MDRREVHVLLKNAFANVVRGSAAAIVAIVLPPFLTRLMSTGAFSAWSLILQLSAYVGYLDFGIQTAVARFVAHAHERGDAEKRDRIVSTSLAALSAAGAIGVIGSIVLALLLPHLFRQMPATLVGGAKLALVLVGGSLAIGLPASVFNGIFIGYQRNEVPAAIIGGSRIVSAVLLIVVVEHGAGLAAMGAAVAAVNILSYAVQYLMYRKMAPDVRLSIKCVTRETGRELGDYCLSLSVWSFAMLLVTGLDIVLVGYFQFQAVAPYAVAASLITFLAGLQGALFSAMIPSTAVLHARGQPAELGRVMVTATRYGNFLLLLTGLPLILDAKSILTVWVGPDYASRGAYILQILVAANVIRLSLTPYAVTLIGTGQQRLVMFTPILEAFSNLIASIALGYLFGAVGVAVGTLFGAIVGLIGHWCYNMPRTTQIQFHMPDYISDGMLRPIICAIPFVIFSVQIRFDQNSGILIGLALAVAVMGTILCFWRWGLIDSERRDLKFWNVSGIYERILTFIG